MKKLNLGCGNEAIVGWVNHDVVALPNVDVVHDLESRPWPFANDEFDAIRAHHVLEHLSNTVGSMQEIHRICRDGARVEIRVPYWNSRDMATDPTHRSQFSEHSFDYFDPSTRHGAERSYYSSARFRVVRRDYWTNFGSYRLVTSPRIKRFLELTARHLGGIIWVLDVELAVEKLPPTDG